jgi:hypothetical protein
VAEYEVRADESKNRLYMTLVGMLDEETASEVVSEIEAAVGRLDPGFTIVNDISEFKPMSEDAVDKIEEGKALAAEAGVDATVRVTGESVIGKMQFERVGGGAESYHVATAETVEEAEELLAEFEG